MAPQLGSKTLGSEWVGMEVDRDIYGYRAFSETGEELGLIQDYVFDESGKLRYLVVEAGFWIFGKRMLVPVGLANVDDYRRRVVFRNLNRELMDAAPGFEGLEDLNPDYENDLIRLFQGSAVRFGRGPDYDRSDLFRVPERLYLLEDRLEEEYFPGFFTG